MNLYSKESPDSRGGPLCPFLDSYAAEMRVEGYAPQTAKIYIRLVTDFGAWLAKRRVEVREITAKFVEQYLEMRARHRRPGQGDLSALKRIVNLLVRQKVIAEPAAVQTTAPTQQILNNFDLHLRDERALAPATRLYYVEFAGKFVTWCFGAGPIDLSRLCTRDVTEFVQRSTKDTRVRMMTTALKSFLRFERYSGKIHLDLAACVPAVANWRLSSIPRALPPAQVELVLASVNRSTAVGQRDYAILLLLARLGLRAGEVATLTLEDINWQAGLMTVRGKGNCDSQLPIPVEVGEAIAEYLRNGRPCSSSRRVFLRSKAPVAGLKGQQAICSIVRHALATAGIDSPRKGSHQFRHGLACQMLSQGASLAEIGELLRHRNPQTTAIYAKVDLVSLKTLALPWPGGAQ